MNELEAPPPAVVDKKPQDLDLRIVTVGTAAHSAMMGAYGRQMNPAQYNLGIRPVTNTAGAHNLQVSNQDFHNLMDEMGDGKDLTISAAERVLVSSLHKFEKRFEPTDDSEKARKLADWCEANLKKVPSRFGWKGLIETLGVGTMRHGFAVDQTVWTYKAGAGHVPWGYFHEHCGSFGFTSMGELVFGMGYGGELEGQVVPPAKFILASADGLYSTPFGRSLYWPLRWMYELKKLAVLGWVGFNDTAGTPVIVVTIPEGYADKKEWQAKVQTLIENLTTLSGFSLPEGFTVDSHPRTGGVSTSPYIAFIQWIDGLITRYLLGGTLNTTEGTNGAGSYAQSRMHGQMTDLVAAPIGQIVEAAIAEYLLKPALLINFGEWALPLVRFVVDTDSKRDVKEAIEIINCAAENDLQMPKSIGRKWLGIPDAKAGEEVIEKRSATPPIPPGSDMTADFSEQLASRVIQIISKRSREGAGRPQAKTAISSGDDDEEGDGVALMSEDWRDAIATFDEPTEHNLDMDRMFVDRIRQLADDVVDSNKEHLAKEILDAVDRLRTHLNDFSPLTLNAIEAANFTGPELLINLENAVNGRRLLAMLNAFKSIRHQIPAGRIPEGLEIDRRYQEATDFLLNRKIISRRDLKTLAQSVSVLDSNLDPRIYEQQLREHVMALAKAPTLEATAKIRNVVVEHINGGQNAGAFMNKIDALVEKGELPGGLDNYYRQVVRQETANAYSAQRDDHFRNGPGSRYVWGRRILHPKLPTGRESHAPLDGLIIRFGSPADVELGRFPINFSCHGIDSAIVVPDPANSTLEETPGALAIVRHASRFNDGRKD